MKKGRFNFENQPTGSTDPTQKPHLGPSNNTLIGTKVRRLNVPRLNFVSISLLLDQLCSCISPFLLSAHTSPLGGLCHHR